MYFDDYGYHNHYGDVYDGYDFRSSGSDYYADRMSNSFDNALMTIILTLIVVSLVVLAVKFGLYILKGCAIYTIAKRMGKEYPWLGFVPFARYYLQGELSGDIKLKRGKIRDAGVWLIALPIARSLVFGVLGAILWVAISVVTGVVFTISSNGAGGVSAMLFTIFLFVLYVLIVILYQVVYRGLRMLVDFQIFERFTSKNMAILHGGFSAILPMYESVCLFVMRNRPFNEGMEPIVLTEEEEPEQSYSMSEAIVTQEEEIQDPPASEEAAGEEKNI